MADWWTEEYGFFGGFYLKGDNSKEGYLSSKKQNLSQRTKSEVDGAIRILNLRKGSHVLDCPCGYGRHSILLSKRGYHITASDINSTHLAEARKKAGKDNGGIKFVKENMLKLKYHSKFDAVINMFYSFGFFKRDSDNMNVLKKFHDALKPNGKLLIHTDVNMPRVISGRYKLNETRTLQDGSALIIAEKYERTSKRMNGSWTIADASGRKIARKYSMRVYTKAELTSLCRKAGFRNMRAYSNWKGDPYSADAEYMIIVAEK